MAASAERLESPLSPKASQVSFSWRGGDDVSSLVELSSEAAGAFAAASTVAGASTVASRMRYAEPSETLILYDWDDTLFPTTEIFDRWGFSSRKKTWKSIMLTDEQATVLEQWRMLLQRYLKIVSQKSERPTIITNSRRPWVTDCVEFFAPSLLPMFDERSGFVRVVYAQELLREIRSKRPQSVASGALYEEAGLTREEHEEQQTKAKMVAMRKEVQSFYSQYSSQSWKNIISVGDMRYEYDAIHEVTFERPSPARERIRTKAIIAPAEPTIYGMVRALHIWCHLLAAVVHFDGDIDIDLGSVTDRAAAFAHALGIPELLELGARSSTVSVSEMTSQDLNGVEAAAEDVGMVIHENLYD